MSVKTLAYRFVPSWLVGELRHHKHLRDLATDVEPEDAAVRRILAPGQTALDVGANYGVFTKLFSELVGPAGSVLAFEPVPITFRTLAAGIERYHLHNVKAINKAVSDHADRMWMTIPSYRNGFGDNLCEAHLTNPSAAQGVFPVDSVTIDSLNLPRVDFIKIDVEGHELEVLKGCRETIAKYHPALLVEVTSPKTVEYLCHEMGYPQPLTVSPSNELFTYRS